MYIGELVQNLIHKLEVGAGQRVLRVTVLAPLRRKAKPAPAP